MPKKTSTGRKSSSVKVGNISGISGNVNVAGGNITTHQSVTGLSGTDIKQLFDGLYAAIEAHPGTAPAEKADLQAEVEEIQAGVTEAAEKNEKVDEGFLARRFRNIARMAPDILDVVVATLASPLAGMGLAVKKIAEKAKAEVKAT